MSVFDLGPISAVKWDMGKLEQITKSVEALEREDVKAFADWFAELQADRWDRQIEADAKAGKLDRFADEALKELRTRPDAAALRHWTASKFWDAFAVPPALSFLLKPSFRWAAPE